MGGGLERIAAASEGQRQCDTRRLNQEMSQLMAEGALGNLLLPQEVYGFLRMSKRVTVPH